VIIPILAICLFVGAIVFIFVDVQRTQPKPPPRKKTPTQLHIAIDEEKWPRRFELEAKDRSSRSRG
jgi:hypothetical protein